LFVLSFAIAQQSQSTELSREKHESNVRSLLHDKHVHALLVFCWLLGYMNSW
jgi:hypothetical protein